LCQLRSDPQAKYFNVGRIGRDQLEDFARHKRIDVVEAERWLTSNLAYEPSLAPA
jgi:5-methyltetrahydrofolate--homocysteine methyltransferase